MKETSSHFVSSASSSSLQVLFVSTLVPLLMMFTNQSSSSSNIGSTNINIMSSMTGIATTLITTTTSNNSGGGRAVIMDNGDGIAADSNKGSNNNVNTLLQNKTLLDPTITSSEQFVNELEQYAINHNAVNHEFLENLISSTGTDVDDEYYYVDDNNVGEKEEVGFLVEKTKAKLLLHFFNSYKHFNLGFMDNVNSLINLLEDDNHKITLEENLREENGYYDEETYVEIETNFNINRSYIENISHPDLYVDMVNTLQKKFHMLYDNSGDNNNHDDKDDDGNYENGGDNCTTTTTNILSPRFNKQIVMDSIRKDGKLGLLSAIYFGSELIVPILYSKLLNGIRNSFNKTAITTTFSSQLQQSQQQSQQQNENHHQLLITNIDIRFLILHIDMDENHAKNLRQIIIDNCITKIDRIILINNTEKILNARVKFYNQL